MKNLAADGRYYWVLATVTPSDQGFLSVRLNPSGPLLDAARDLYREVLALESRVEEDQGKKAAIEASTALLVSRLGELGFAGYDEFMRAALRDEVSRRPTAPRDASPDSATAIGELHDALGRLLDTLGSLFASLDVFEELNTQLAAKSDALQELGPSLCFLALNSQLAATRLGPEGAVLSVVSKHLGEHSKQADRLTDSLLDRLRPVCDLARAVAFDVEVAQVEAEVCEAFVVELLHGAPPAGGVGDSLRALSREVVGRCAEVMRGIERLVSETRVLRETSRGLVRQVEQMRVAQLNGRIESATLSEANSFATTFEEIEVIVTEAQRAGDEVTALFDGTSVRLESMLEVDTRLTASLADIGDAVDRSILATV